MKKLEHINQDNTMRTVMTMPPTFRTQYSCADPVAESDKTGLKCEDPTLAQQHFKDQCDINILFAKYLETGTMPQVAEGLTYGNFEGIFDFQTAMNSVRTAQGLFDQLPARIKNRFDNDPQKLLVFLADQDNREEAIFLGLVDKEPNDTSTDDAPKVSHQAPQQPAPATSTNTGASQAGQKNTSTAKEADRQG